MTTRRTHKTWLAGALLATLAFALVLATPEPSSARVICQKADRQIDSITKKRARAAIQCLVNKNRSAKNLRSQSQLIEAGQGHSKYMRNHGCFSHQCYGEASLDTRIRRTGYLNGARSYGYGEVIATNSRNRSPRDFVRQWMNSSSHRSALRDSRFEHLGIGVGIKGRRAYITGDLGRRSG